MFNIYTILLSCVIILSLYSCTKKGCTDKTALNYDINAIEDNGSCTYDYAEIWSGTYLATDTLRVWNGTWDTTYSQHNFIITKVNTGLLKIINFVDCTDTLYATMIFNSNLIIVRSDNDCFDNTEKYIGVHDNYLKYGVFYDSAYKHVEIKGIAIKQ